MINFKSLIDRSVETLCLWQVLNEHNVEDVLLHLDTVRHFFNFFFTVVVTCHSQCSSSHFCKVKNHLQTEESLKIIVY